MDGLFLRCKKAGVGCRLGNFFAALFGFADDLLLACPSRTGLQKLLNIASEYAAEHRISFSTNPIPAKSKTKGMIMSRSKKISVAAPLFLNGSELSWVTQAKYLGCTWTSQVDGLSKDIMIKRNIYVANNIQLCQEFAISHPAVKCSMNSLYNAAFYGSGIWDLSGEAASRLYNAWSVSVRQMWDIPRETHRRFIEPLGGRHAASIIASNYCSFLRFIGRCRKLPALIMLHKCLMDSRTQTARNVSYILNKLKIRRRPSSLLSLENSFIKQNFNFVEAAEGDSDRINMIKEVTDLRRKRLVPSDEEFDMSDDEFKHILRDACCS